MKTLYESILSSNKAGATDTIKSIISKMPKDDKELEKLNYLWDKLGLSIQNFSWIIRNSVLAYSKKIKDDDPWGNNYLSFIYRTVGVKEIDGIFLHITEEMKKIMPEKDIKKYAEKICKTIGTDIKKSDHSTIDIKFK